jgi:hypothetical protein
MAAVSPPDPYKSARDLPIVAEMLEQIRGGKLLTRFVARDQRASLEAVERQLDHLVATVDGFYDLLGDRHWIFHESLNTDLAKGLLAKPADEAEQMLIAHYQDPETLRFMIQRLWHFPEMQARRQMIDRAREDYEAGRYDSTVLSLIPVMDGFVNDVEKDPRRGLHAREDDEMAAWNSAVGHHQGLTLAHRTFTKTFKKTSDEEVHELYRNGIVHGMLTNFNNVVVGTKAWNRLFAVADWALSREKQAIPPEPKPSLRALFGQIAENQRTQRVLDAWQPRTLTPEDPGFEDESIHALAVEVLKAWKAKNYGRMAAQLASLTREDTQGKSAGRVRDEYMLFELEGFRIVRIDFRAAVICEIDVELTIDGETKIGRIRWIRETDGGETAIPGHEDGEWRLMTWGPLAMFHKAEEDTTDDDLLDDAA